MSQDQLDALTARLASDPAFAAALAAPTTAEDAQRIAAERGFDVTTGEVAAALVSSLSNAELEVVSGGRTYAHTGGPAPCGVCE
jgi:predicted ribosomally synthesized peptide with nif11-like leader